MYNEKEKQHVRVTVLGTVEHFERNIIHVSCSLLLIET